MKSLILAEKPSVAKDITKALTSKYGRFQEHEDHFENDQFIVTSAIGHLLEICVNENDDPKKDRWKLATLPKIPVKFDIRPVEKTKKRLFAVSKLMQRKDVDTLINACDAGREGELIFRLIEQFASEKRPLNKPVKRLWLQSMTTQAILHGMDNLRTEDQMKGLNDAARCRSEADWIVGINGTRTLTAFNSIGGGFNLTTMGRVQTPTLCLMVDRENKIVSHVARPYIEILPTFKVSTGEYVGKWFDPNWVKGGDPDDRADRNWFRDQAKQIDEAIRDKEAVIVSEDSKTQTQASPFLFDLTTLQREANSKFGMSAKNTLATAQALYEKHKVLTYPRTDARCLPEDYVVVAKKTIETFANSDYKGLDGFAKQALDKNYIWPNKKIFNNEKITDHFAIIPTGIVPRGLDEYEQRIYDLVLKRFIAVFFPAAEFHVVTRITGVDNYRFKSEGKVLKVPGWMAIYGKESVGDDQSPILVDVAKGEKPKVKEVNLIESLTKPPARYNEASLLGAMENVGKVIEGDEAKEAMKGKGLGTPATRAAIIEGLIHEEYVHRQGKEIIPNPKATQLMILLKGLEIEDFTSPELTGEWEHKLSLMESGKFDRGEFMVEINTLITRLVEKARGSSPNTLKGDGVILDAQCPSCGSKSLVGNYRSFECVGSCGFKVPRFMMGRNFLNEELKTLVNDGRIGPLHGFRSRMGKEFSTVVVLKRDEESALWSVKPEYQERDPAPATLDLSGKEPLTTCPCCKGEVYDFNTFYGCVNSMRIADKEATCKFRVSKSILQQEISFDDLRDIATKGKTSLLTKFISSRTNKPFSAMLGWDNKAKRTTFEFEPRKEKPAKKK